MSKTILITGATRSGKSQLAEAKIAALGLPAIYIATAQVYDSEMAARVKLHKDRRGTQWQLRHAPRDLCTALDETDGGPPRLVDCLTMWLTNLMLDEADWQAESYRLADTLARMKTPVVLVTNEVGWGIVPETRLGRQFRDAQGIVNQRIACVCDEVYLAVCGLPMKVKPQ
ncbi:bifunctional adenosylcobinamide kinase/adenosylcobinamide-phosphate guanylyltransferase [Rhodobacteraceae bacterium]|nr:bifunctional adenosylcobinamide kinase/adenosylcobinamide-phosphate guanylyltransferase [Paracoccaceae bacterium]